MTKNQEDSFLPDEDETGVDELAVSRLIDGVISEARQECSQSREGNLKISTSDLYWSTEVYLIDEGQVVYPEYSTSPRKDPTTLRSKPKKTVRKGRKGKKIDKSEGKNTTEVAENTETITLSMGQFRNMITAEAKSKARIIQHYYLRDWCQQNGDKVNVNNEIHALEDQCRELEQLNVMCSLELQNIKKTYSTLSAEKEAIKKAKRSKRNAAKLRRSQQQAQKSVSSSKVEM